MRKSIYSPVEHLQWSFFHENLKRFLAVNYFPKKAPLQMIGWVLNTSLKCFLMYFDHNLSCFQNSVDQK